MLEIKKTEKKKIIIINNYNNMTNKLKDEQFQERTGLGMNTVR